MERPERIDLVVNLKVAKAFGLTMPLPLRLPADEVTNDVFRWIANMRRSEPPDCSPARGARHRQPPPIVAITAQPRSDIRHERAAGEDSTVARIAHRIAARTLS